MLYFVPFFLSSFLTSFFLSSPLSSFFAFFLLPSASASVLRGKASLLLRSRRSTTHEVKAASSQESSTQAAANDGIELVSGEAELIEQAGGSGRRAGCWRCQCKPTPCSPQPNPTRQPFPIHRKCLGGSLCHASQHGAATPRIFKQVAVASGCRRNKALSSALWRRHKHRPKDQRKVSYEILYALFSL